MNIVRRRRLASIARRAANKMSKPEQWCQGAWAVAENGASPSEAHVGTRLAVAKCGAVPHDYIEANSPTAVKFCVEGAIFNAVGKVFKLVTPGYGAAQDVIDLLDQKVAADEENEYEMAQTLNDTNGDASRKRLVKHLRAVARDLT